MRRRHFISAARAGRSSLFHAILCAFFVFAALAAPRASTRELPPAAAFDEFLQGLWPSAREAGVTREVFDAAIKGLTLEPGIFGRTRTQAEFTVSIPAYLANSVTLSRIARGRALARELSAPLARITSQTGVPSETLVAILGVESNFGTATGGADALRVLATLAYGGHRGRTFSDELVAALVMLQSGQVARGRLRGSWAGAMGEPQFLPSAYLRYAVSYAGDRPADIWTSHADSLASIANFLKSSGWNPGLPWGMEVVVPKNFDFASFDLDLSQWRALGFTRATGEALPASGAASLYLPAGAAGPAFLITDNFEVIRQYNTSDAYALSVALLADRIAGRNVPVAPWPKATAALSTDDCRTLQRLLAERGFYRGAIDGKLGRSSRNAVHAFQSSEGMQPADGLATKQVLERLRAP